MQAKCVVLLNEAENKHWKKKSLQYTHTHTHKKRWILTGLYGAKNLCIYLHVGFSDTLLPFETKDVFHH